MAYIDTNGIPGTIQEVVAYVVPTIVPASLSATVSDRGDARLLDGNIGVYIALPGLITAIFTMRATQPNQRRNRCRSCGYDLTEM